MVPNVDYQIVLSLTLVEKQRRAFPRQKFAAHISVSGGLTLPSADRYDVTSGAKLKIVAVSKL